jgi:hypothetical protein
VVVVVVVVVEAVIVTLNVDVMIDSVLKFNCRNEEDDEDTKAQIKAKQKELQA